MSSISQHLMICILVQARKLPLKKTDLIRTSVLGNFRFSTIDPSTNKKTFDVNSNSKVINT